MEMKNEVLSSVGAQDLDTSSYQVSDLEVIVWTKKDRNHSITGIIVSTPHWLIQLSKTSFTLSFYTLSVYIKAIWFYHSPTTLLRGFLTLDQIQWLWLSEISSQEWQEVPKKFLWQLGAYCCLKDNKQFLNNHLARVPVTPNQQGTHEMRDEVFSSVSAQEGLDWSGYQVSADLDVVQFYWENNQLDSDVVFRPGIGTPFSPTAFDD